MGLVRVSSKQRLTFLSVECALSERSTLLLMTLHPHPKPQRLSTCLRHPSEPFTGFCASCLRERLAGIDPATHQEICSGSRHCNVALRRSQSCSGAKAEAVPSCLCEVPRRKSCDVRVRNTLWELFNIDDERNGDKKFEVEIGSLGFEVRENAASGVERRASVNVIEPVVDPIDDFVEEEIELKTMKEFIDLEWRKKKKTGKDFTNIAGSVWETASIFSKKLRKSREKQKMKNIGAVEKTPGETQSEVGDYGLGRRFRDTDPRFSVDAGRISMIERACLDLMPMASVIDNKVSIESNSYSINGKERSPGGSAQTKDYYTLPISPMQRRRSFDRSSSHRKASMADLKVSPATTQLFYRAKMLITEVDLKDSNSEGIKESTFDGNVSDPKSIIDQKRFNRAHKWHKMWNVLRFVQKQSESSHENEESFIVRNSIDQPLAKANGSVSHNLIRSFSVRNNDPSKMDGLSSADIKLRGTRRKEEAMLQKNRRVEHSPNNLDHGLLRFYLTPLRSYRRSNSVD